MKPLAAALAALTLVGLNPSATASELQNVEIDEWTVPFENSRPRDPYVADDGRVWFVGQTGDYVGWLDPGTGAFGRHALPDGAGPHNLVIDDEGFIWYAGNRDRHIGRMDPATGEIERIDMPESRARDPHTLTFNHDGDLWFTLQGANLVGFLDVESRAVSLIDVPTPRSRPYGIVVDDKNVPWLNLLGNNKLATVDPETHTLTEIETPRANARTRRLAATESGIWYVDWAGGYLGRFEPDTGSFDEWSLPGGEDSRPYAMAADSKGRIWLFETGVSPNRLLGFDPSSEEFFASGTVPSGGGTVRHMVYHEPTNTLWFGADTNTIGRARLP